MRAGFERAGMIEGLHIDNERTLSKVVVFYKGTCIRRQWVFINETVGMQPAQHCRHFGARQLPGCWGFLARPLEVGVRPLGPEVV